jgi:uncharacterized membrane protein
VSGVLLVARGHRSGQLLVIHKASFVIWGAGARAMLVAASIGGGAALALSLLSTIDRWG